MNAPGISEPCCLIASSTMFAFETAGTPVSRIRTTPACVCRCRKTSSPKSLSHVRRRLWASLAGEHFFVGRSRADFSKIADAEPTGAKRVDNCFIYALVCDEVHAAESG